MKTYATIIKKANVVYKMKKNKINKKIIKEIQKHDVISFDIFDTLLCRPYMHPTDVFKHLEIIENADGFMKERIAAEKRTRIKLEKFSEIKFDEIYCEISDKYKPLKTKELELEYNTLYPNPKMQEIFNYAVSQGKKIIIISDMYLSSDFLKKILYKNKYIGFEKIYVSSDLRENKHTCKLFKLVTKDLNLKPEQILHIGDDEYSDFIMAQKCGITALCCKKPSTVFFEKRSNKRFEVLYQSDKTSLAISIILGMLIRKNLYSKKMNYWESFGYTLGGPVCYGLSKYLFDEIKQSNIKEAIFVARDGFTLQKIFNIIQDKSIKNHYVYAPRFINMITNADYYNFKNNKIKLIIDYFLETSKELSGKKQRKLKKISDYNNFIKQNSQILIELIKKEIKNYKNYLEEFNFCEKEIALVDFSTSSFSSFDLLSRVLPEKEILGLYWFIDGSSKLNGRNCKDFRGKFNKHNKTPEFFTDYNIMEFLITSPEFPVKTLRKCKPVYIKNKYELARKNAYAIISDFEILFTKDLKEVFKDTPVIFDENSLVKFVNIFSINPTLLDFYNLTKIYHGTSEDHKDYVPMMNFSYQNSFVKILKSIFTNEFFGKFNKFLKIFKYCTYY